MPNQLGEDLGAANGGRAEPSFTELLTPGMRGGWWTVRFAWAARGRISARRAQASAIVTRRAETAPAGSVRRSRIERYPKGDAQQRLPMGPPGVLVENQTPKDTADPHHQIHAIPPPGGSLAAGQGARRMKRSGLRWAASTGRRDRSGGGGAWRWVGWIQGSGRAARSGGRRQGGRESQTAAALRGSGGWRFVGRPT